MNTISINGAEYNIKKLTPHSVATIANIIGTLTIEGRKVLKGFGIKEDGQFLWGILAAMTEDSLVKFSAALINHPDLNFVKENFDLSWIMEALKIQVEISNIRGLFTNFTLLASQDQQ